MAAHDSTIVCRCFAILVQLRLLLENHGNYTSQVGFAIIRPMRRRIFQVNRGHGMYVFLGPSREAAAKVAAVKSVNDKNKQFWDNEESKTLRH